MTWGARGIAATLLLAVLVVAAGCLGPRNGNSHVVVLGADGNTGQQFSDNFADQPGALLGMRGTTPLTKLSEEFRERLLELAPDLKDFNYSAESYDAVIITALAAELARTSEGTQFAPFINGVTTRGVKCGSFLECKSLIDQGQDIDYDGISGILEFAESGEPTVASYGVLKHERGNATVGYNRLSADIEYLTVGDKSGASSAQPPVPLRETEPTRRGLKYGALLSQTGLLAHTGPPMIAAVRLAINDLNDAGGVNGGAVSVVERDDSSDADKAVTAASALLRVDVDVVIGCAGSAASLATIEPITAAGVVLFSPSNTSDKFTAYPDHGLYFRTAPPDVLQAQALANLIKEDGGDRVAIMYQETAYGSGLAENIKGELISQGTSSAAVLLVGYQPNATVFVDEVAKVDRHRPDHVVVVGYDESKDVIKTLNEKGIGPAR